jgi:hypothetical protein
MQIDAPVRKLSLKTTFSPAWSTLSDPLDDSVFSRQERSEREHRT